MHHRSAGLFAASALGASALILPPGIAPASSDDGSTLPSIVNPKNQLIQLPCSACAFSVDDEPNQTDRDFNDLFWIQGAANDVVLNFTVSQDGSALELGGKAIYAPRSQTNTLLRGEPLYVHQVPATKSEVDEDQSRKLLLEVTSVGLSTEAEVRASPEGDVIVQLQLQIMGLEGQLMHLDGVRIHLLQSSTGEFLILRLDVVPDSTFTPFPGIAPPTSPAIDMSNGKDCTPLATAFCKLRNFIEAKMSNMRQSQPGPPLPLSDLRGPPPHMMRPPINSDHLDFDPRPPHHHGRPHHVRPHGSHHHNNYATIGSFTRSVISILIPVMAGITVGLLVSLLGLLVGRMIGFCWEQVYPGGHKNSPRRRSRRSRRRAAADEGKILLIEDDPEPLPVYEDAPAYEEIESQPN